MEYLLILIFFALGCFIGSKFNSFNKASGEIVITEDEDGTYLSLRVGSMTDITTKKNVLLRVSHK